MKYPHFLFVAPLAATLLASGNVGASAPTDNARTPPATSSSEQEMDLSRYYPSRDAANAELETVSSEAKALPSTESLAQLGAYLDRTNALFGRVRRLSAFFMILAARNIDDQAASAGEARVDALADSITAKLEKVLGSLPSDKLGAKLRGDPHLAPYRYLADEVADDASHQPPIGTSRVLAEVGSPALATYWKIYQKLDRLTVDDTTSSDRNAANSSDRSAREVTWRRGWKVTAAKAEANAAILLGIVKEGEAVAKLEGYPDAASAGYASRDLSKPMISASLAAVAANLELYQSYQRLQEDQIRRAGVADPEPWDQSLLKSGVGANFSFDDARAILPQALAPLGADYVQHFTALLAPTSGRLDIASRTGNRESGGFSVNAPGVPSGLYIASFGGSLNDMRVVIHEGGHAVAAQYLNEGGTPSVFARGPNWLMEGYALFNEMMLYDYLAKNSASPVDRAYYENALLNDMMFQVFGSAEEATLEQSIYDGVAAGRIQSVSDLNETTYGVMKTFEVRNDEILHTRSTLWSTKELMYQDPFYLVNYMYAGMIAINLYREAKLHPDTFPARYTALLRRGYDAEPLTLLAPLLGKQSPDSLAKGAFDVIRSELAKVTEQSKQ